MIRMLLLSNSGSPYLEYALGEIDRQLEGVNVVGFVSAAKLGGSRAENDYFEQARLVLEREGRSLLHLKWDGDGLERLEKVGAVFVGGGNTYALLDRLRRSGMLSRLAQRVREGMPYIGSSAGPNITCPTILTTHDWNVCGVTEFAGMNLFPWQINPHYFAGEIGLPRTAQREPRIAEFHLVRDTPVLAIEEQTGLFWDGDSAKLFGIGRARLFRLADEPKWIAAGEKFSVTTSSH